jgi:signal transduction histidine kinase
MPNSDNLQLKILNFSKIIAPLRELSKLLNTTVNQVKGITNSDQVVFWMLKKDHIQILAQTFNQRSVKEGGSLYYATELKKNLLNNVIVFNQPLIENDIEKNPLNNLYVDEANKFETKTVLAVPVIAGNKKILGFIELRNKSAEFTKETQYTVEILAGFLANSLESIILQQQLEKANVELQAELERKVEELRELNEHLEERIRVEVQRGIELAKKAMLGEMIAAIVHQWKQPINIIRMNTSSSLMLHDMGNLSDEDLRENFAMIDNQLDYMVKTMNDFKDFLKPARLIAFDINDSIDSIIFMLGKIYEGKGIKVIVEGKEGLKVNAFQAEFEQVIINLLNNARDIIVEKQPAKKDVVIEYFEEGDDIVITVSDFAGGIPDDIVDKIFDSYFTTKGDDGTGIGLDICKEIVKKVHGTIHAENVEHEIFGDEKIKGAKFVIKIPKHQDENND